MTFGFETIIDLLSWTAAILVGIKLIATLVLLPRSPETRFDGRFAMPLWWSTKITPVLAVPCMIAIAVIERRASDFWAFSALMLFVVVMVPVMIWKRFHAKPAEVLDWIRRCRPGDGRALDRGVSNGGVTSTLQCWISPAEIDALPLGRRSLTVSIPATTQAAFELNLSDFPHGRIAAGTCGAV